MTTSSSTDWPVCWACQGSGILDPCSGLAATAPPYLRIALDLRRRILSGDLAPGDRLPSNSELRATNGVASQTAQNAITVLKNERLVHGVTGRGVFVNPRPEPPAPAPDGPSTTQVVAVLDSLRDLLAQPVIGHHDPPEIEATTAVVPSAPAEPTT